MNTMYFWLLTFLAMALPVAADIEVRISVKFIKNSNGDRPTNSGTDIDISTPLTFDVEITHANKVLEATGRGYQIKVVEYLDIQPPAPVDQFADFWYALAARENRRVFVWLPKRYPLHARCEPRGDRSPLLGERTGISST